MSQPWSPVLAEPDARIAPISIEDWATLPEDSPGEFVDGYLAEEEVPDPVHELAVSWLIALFRSWLGSGRGFVFGSDVKFVIDTTRGRKPDVSVYFPHRPAPPRRGPLREAPDLVVEVVSPSPSDERRDRVHKMDEYAAFGVSFYWLLDPALGSLEIFELQQGSPSQASMRRTQQGRYARVLARVEGVIDQVPGCEGLTLDLDGLWTELRRLSAEDRA
jgi:Uma2 family endonuclease